jgi:hypothetical protein
MFFFFPNKYPNPSLKAFLDTAKKIYEATEQGNIDWNQVGSS